jgi:hypothetical protein
MFRLRTLLIVSGLALCAGAARAGTAANASLYFYAVPGADNYLQPTVKADEERLHLEARYNYESKNALSLWGGYKFIGGGTISAEITPMLGLVAGGTSGVAPGAELALGWKAFELYSEGEYMYDFDEHSDSFFYSWSELTVSLPLAWRVGAALQRTQRYETPREFQPGLLVGTTFGAVQVTAHVFDLDLADHTWVLAASMAF